jgi:DNA polymerase-3 subunit delta'
MAFSDILGHERQLELLRRALERNRLHHAYLFVGPGGVGKGTVALSLALAIHCTQGDHDFCGQCENCHRIRDGNHPDVRVIAPEANKREISIQQMRGLQRLLEFRSYSGKKKVAIIDPAHQMNYHAQNSLLKTLEDPPGDALIILVANSTGSLLSTVLSRCLRLYFAFLPVGDVAGFLVRQQGTPQDQATVLAVLTGGSLGEALACDAGELLDERNQWIERFSSLSRGDYRGLVSLAEEMARDREKALRSLQWVREWYRDILIQQTTGSAGEMRNSDLVHKIRDAASKQSLNHTLSVLSQMSDVAGKLQRNYNRRLVLEDFFIRVVAGDPPRR